MRLVRITDEIIGEKVSKKIISDKGVTLMPKGAKINKKAIENLLKMGYKSVYIESELDHDFEDMIDPVERKKNVNNFKKISTSIIKFSEQSNRQQNYKSILKFSSNIDKELKEIIEGLVSHIKTNQKLTMVDIKSENNYFYEHQINVSLLSLFIGKLAKLSRNDMKQLAKASLVYDIGIFLMDKSISELGSKLDKEKESMMKLHTQKAYDFLKETTNLSIKEMLPAIQHHERIDGSGYPLGLIGDNIHIFSKIIAIADVYDSLTSDKPDRKAIPQAEAIEHLMASAGTTFDYELTNLFVKNIIPYPKGTKVRLSNGAEAIVVSQAKDLPLRPRVLVINSEFSGASGYLSLTEKHNITITKVIMT